MNASDLLDPADPKLFKALVEQLPDAVILTDRDGVVRVWNQGAERVFGFAAHEAIGKSLDFIVPERLRAAHWEGFGRAIRNGRTRLGNEVRTTRSMHKDGRKLYVDLSFGLLTDAAGIVTGSVAVGRDCSARYLAHKALAGRLAVLEPGASPS
ncbi:MAG: PAS domain S-box protein [Methylibium sp.]|uniref:PAS domain-containing protein n=1 Tax=Methylibium sp. TaxID=2067992 RepID=UPI0017FE74C3|nr:PAS domain S-box protein [Methylibium sp.]MBA2723124.1 PAS domain S-box protein [Methylibium sp.]MBA3591140.1 PAS domain S-box protein [Methylibium sp.]